MEKRYQFFIHVGYPKTATTTLQKRLFARHPDICYLGKPFANEFTGIERAMLELDSIQFKRELSGLRTRFLAILAECADRHTVLLSHEGFLRPTRYNGHDLGRTAERIKRVMCEPLQASHDFRVLITVRKQVDIIPSYFFHFESRSPERFRQFIKSSLARPRQGYFASLFYDDVVGFYGELFGSEHVKVMLFEDFVTDREAFLAGLAGYLGIEYAASLDAAGSGSLKKKARSGSGYRITANEYLLGALQKYRPRTEQLPWLLRVLLKRIPLRYSTFAISPADRESIEALFAEPNRRLAEMSGLALDHYGYF